MSSRCSFLISTRLCVRHKKNCLALITFLVMKPTLLWVYSFPKALKSHTKQLFLFQDLHHFGGDLACNFLSKGFEISQLNFANKMSKSSCNIGTHFQITFPCFPCHAMGIPVITMWLFRDIFFLILFGLARHITAFIYANIINLLAYGATMQGVYHIVLQLQGLTLLHIQSF